MAVHHSGTQQWAMTAVNHNTFISVINTTKNMCVCVQMFVCVCVRMSTHIYIFYFYSLTSEADKFSREHFVMCLQ